MFFFNFLNVYTVKTLRKLAKITSYHMPYSNKNLKLGAE